MMRFMYVLAMSYASLASSLVWAESCSCTTFPFQPDPPCFDQCSATLILEADPDRLQAVLDLSQSAVNSIREVRMNAILPKNLPDLSGGFQEAEFSYVKEKLRGMSETEFRYLQDSTQSLK